MVYGNPWWDKNRPPVPCPQGCGHRVHWNPCETAETPLMPAGSAGYRSPRAAQLSGSGWRPSNPPCQQAQRVSR
jgi:hypothetical protein